MDDEGLIKWRVPMAQEVAERLTRERDEARAEIDCLLDVLRAIAGGARPQCLFAPDRPCDFASGGVSCLVCAAQRKIDEARAEFDEARAECERMRGVLKTYAATRAELATYRRGPER